ncbi:MAG: glycoside hydrolase family 97 catalytic domain-containing protein [Bacteroidaceae bacterium]|nr:glycoside hydrolase family 97 catalytic domain-containing protein [Bacteroidaceae bacterium]
MKNKVIANRGSFMVLFLLVFVAICGAQERRELNDATWTVESPDSQTRVTVSLNRGLLTYEAGYIQKGKKNEYVELLESSPLGLYTNEGDFSRNLEAVGEPTISKRQVSYTVRQSKKANVDTEYTTALFPLKAEGGRRMTLELWVGDCKIAFRYLVPMQGECAALVVNGEVTGFNLPDEATSFICPQSDALIGWKRTKPSYEEEYVLDAPMGTPSKYGHGWTFPCLFRVGQKGWVEISETGLDGRYCGSHLSEGSHDGLFTIAFPMPEENNGFGSTGAQIGLPGTTPWRTVSLAPNLAPIVESTVTWDVVEELYEPSQEYKGGRSTWSWIIWQDESIVYDDQVTFIDLAARLGWEYCLIDGGWETNIGRERMEQLFAYAKEKGVAPFVWYNSNGGWNDAPQCAKNRMYSPIVRKKEMAWLAKHGVKGIKVDFFGGDKQETIKLYEQILSDANDYGIQVIFHGCTLPRGWERMYPNYVGSEAVLASENLVFNQHFDDMEGQNACLHPFIRNAVGSMEFGGTVLQRHLTRSGKGGRVRVVGDAFELATAIAFQNIVQNFALTPLDLETAPAFEIDFMKQVPTQWQDARFLEGYPGKYCVLARQAMDGKWYVAVMNADQNPRTITLNLNLLKGSTSSSQLPNGDAAHGKWQMINDGADGKSPSQIAITADKKGILKLTVAPKSGAVLF